MTWWQALDAIMKQVQPPHAYRYDSLSSRRKLLDSLGFVDIDGQYVRLPINSDNTAVPPWPLNEWERRLGRYYGDTLADANCDALDALSAAAFTRYGTDLPEPWEKFKWAVRDEMMKQEVHVYHLL